MVRRTEAKVGLDVYAGTLTRYYSDDWEPFWVRAAREAGIESMVMRDGAIVEKGDPEAVGRAVRAWRDAVNEELSGAPGEPRLDWDESEDRPYYTNKPGWEGYAALMLHAAYAMNPGMQPPAEVLDDWREDPAYRVSIDENLGGPCSYIMGPEMWLPGEFGFLFTFRELRSRDEVVIGSVDYLLSNLHGLNERTFRASPETAARWLTGEVEAETHFEANARHGFAILLYLAEQAVDKRLPLKLDY